MPAGKDKLVTRAYTHTYIINKIWKEAIWGTGLKLIGSIIPNQVDRFAGEAL